MITVMLSGQQRESKALKVCGPGPVKTGTGRFPLLSSPPADFRGFFTSSVRAPSRQTAARWQRIVGVKSRRGAIPITTGRRAEGASWGLLNQVAERIR